MVKIHILSFMAPTLFACILRDICYLLKYAQKSVFENTRHFCFMTHKKLLFAEPNVISNQFCTPIIFKIPFKTGFSTRNILLHVASGVFGLQ